MKLLVLFCGISGLLLGSATPPPAEGSQPITPSYTPMLAYEDVASVEPAGPTVTFTQAPPAIKTPEAEAEPMAVAERPRSHGVKVVISLPQQKAYVFRDGELFATSPVSTGKRGYETPAGTFPILQKKVHHRSNKYSNAPMPYMQRLTWSGVAIHAGSLPGYPASHGCIRLPRSFARKLYGITDFDTQVTVTRQRPRSASEALNLA